MDNLSELREFTEDLNQTIEKSSRSLSRGHVNPIVPAQFAVIHKEGIFAVVETTTMTTQVAASTIEDFLPVANAFFRGYSTCAVVMSCVILNHPLKF